MSDLSRKVIAEIERRKLKPTPVFVFLARRAVFWCLAGVSVLIGGLAVAFGLFALTDWRATGGRGVDEMAFDDAAIMLPFAAVVFLVLAAASAALSFAKTKRGYRISFTRAAVMALLAAALTGLALHAASIGSAVDANLRRNISAYRDYVHIPYAEWSQPEQGKLGGAALQMVNAHLVKLRDFQGREWLVDIADAEISFDETPVEEGDIAVRGRVTGPGAFTATHVDPFD
jgi:hypothetical protein